jgi:predicted dienelactone hydrolase
MRRRRKGLALALLALTLAPVGGAAAAPAGSAPPPIADSQTGVDAPELARLGPYRVGVMTLSLSAPGVTGRSRELLVDIWYPARRGGAPTAYKVAFPGETPGTWTKAVIPGIAVRGAPAVRSQGHPLVIVSHGYSGAPAALSWLTENLASKGYVVAAPRHDDPPITDRSKFQRVAAQRPLDIIEVTHELQARARRRAAPLGGLVDADRVALIGYSMGGYGVLTAAGADLSPAFAATLPGQARTAFVASASSAAGPKVEGLRAVVAISPAGGMFGAWTAEGLAGLRQPLLFLVGDQDRTVGFDPGVRSIYQDAVNAPRDLLVFEGAGHAIGMDDAPPQMRARLWDLDWFEDPVWRKPRLIGVNLHVITAFLELHLNDRKDARAYLALTPRSADGPWPAELAYGAYSPGPPTSGVWKGFQRTHATGLTFAHRDPALVRPPPSEPSQGPPKPGR